MGYSNHEEPPAPLEDLTRRELEILALLAEARSNREIADQLTLSLNTVKWYARQIYAKLGVGNRRQAANAAKRLGLLKRSSGDRLPVPTTELIGRVAELEAILHLLIDPDQRLLVLTGLGGIGKSRLALEAAIVLSQKHPEVFHDGISYVTLVPQMEFGAILSALVSRFEISLDPGSEGAAEQLGEHLRSKEMLLILDNLEPTPEVTRLVNTLHASAPGLNLLITSREPLGFRSESVFELKGLKVPVPGQTEGLELLPSVVCFIACAHRFDRTASFDREDLQCVGKICRLVDGLPLAIELAAAWVPTLACVQIAAEIESGLDLLAVELQDLPPRQRSIQAVMDQSWQQLDDSEREVLARLSVFTGGFTREAAERVAGSSLKHLASLVRKSFIQRVESDRYVMHALIRQFGQSKLDQLGGSAQAYRSHAMFFGDLLLALQSDLQGGAQLKALDCIAADLEDIRSAWNWAIRERDHQLIEHLLESLYLYSFFRRGRIDGVELLERAEHTLAQDARPDAARTLARVGVRTAMLYIDTARSRNPAELEHTKESIRQSLTAALEAEDEGEIVFCMHAFGRTEMWLGNPMRAREIFEEALEVCARIEDDFHEAYILFRIGLCCSLVGDKAGSVEFARKSLAIARRRGNRYVEAWALGTLASGVFEIGELDESVACREESIRIHDEMGDRQGAAWERAWRALTACVHGDVQTARRLSEEGIEDAKQMNMHVTLGHALAISSWISIRQGDFTEARKTAERAHELSKHTPYGPGLANYALGYVDAMEGRFDQAKREIRGAVQTFRRLGFLSLGLLCLPVVSLLLLNEGRGGEAAELMGLTMRHERRPVVWLDQDRMVVRVQKDLSAAIGDEAKSEAMERGAGRDLELMLKDISQGAY